MSTWAINYVKIDQFSQNLDMFFQYVTPVCIPKLWPYVRYVLLGWIKILYNYFYLSFIVNKFNGNNVATRMGSVMGVFVTIILISTHSDSGYTVSIVCNS